MERKGEREERLEKRGRKREREGEGGEEALRESSKVLISRWLPLFHSKIGDVLNFL